MRIERCSRKGGLIPVFFFGRMFVTLGVGFAIGFFAGEWQWPLMFSNPPSALAATCDNDGTADAGETCSSCPYDVRCTAAQKCIAGACSGTNWDCKREDICGDGWVSSAEACDDGGLCTGGTNAAYQGRDCFTLDPDGNTIAGVARCRATGGICVAQDGDGCTAICDDECEEEGGVCFVDADCCGGDSCTNGVCGAGGIPTGCLQGYWKMNEGVGTAINDSSGMGNNGVIGGITTWLADSLKFDGGYVDITNETPFAYDIDAPFTLSICFNGDETDEDIFLGKQSDGVSGYIFEVDNWDPSGSNPPTRWTMNFYLNNAGGNMKINGQTPVNDNKWHHGAVTYDGSKTTEGVKIYLDGALDGPMHISNDTLGPQSMLTPGSKFEIGARLQGDQPYTGALSDARVYNCKLTPAEIAEIAALDNCSGNAALPLPDPCGNGTCEPNEECSTDCFNCSDSIDNDSDSLMDCVDPGCANDPGCL